ncbi:hypothetical protein NGB36_25075 [Streptomyces sp. RB6PN25]|uniref:Uncharacterized protein n=1 Tax=Streptomyces humicola TaxID=2953240 RepID=A0ABT1Q1G5_9ACTN|nr:hypothetical protein [Streptomyces humicola]MCQ4083776.1 hypothetical protein [Streptomyces humicola]
MRIELTWPRADAADRTLSVAVPEIPVTDLLRRAVTSAEPVVSSAAATAGAGVLVQLALPFAVRLARQTLNEGPGTA